MIDRSIEWLITWFFSVIMGFVLFVTSIFKPTEFVDMWRILMKNYKDNEH